MDENTTFVINAVPTAKQQLVAAAIGIGVTVAVTVAFVGVTSIATAVSNRRTKKEVAKAAKNTTEEVV